MSEDRSLTHEPHCNPQDISYLQERAHQLENSLREQQMRNGELEQLLAGCREQLEEESFKSGVLELDLNQHKEALLEKVKELRERDETIDTQNCLLGFAWAETQKLASAQRDRDQTILALKSHIEDISLNVEAWGETGTSKKRRLIS